MEIVGEAWGSEGSGIASGTDHSVGRLRWRSKQENRSSRFGARPLQAVHAAEAFEALSSVDDRVDDKDRPTSPEAPAMPEAPMTPEAR